MTDWSLTLSAPAKINLYLGVHTERDDRGYHRVDSLMAAVGLSDTVTATPAQALTVQTVPGIRFSHAKEYGVSGCGCYGRALWSRSQCLHHDREAHPVVCRLGRSFDGCRGGHYRLGRELGYRPCRSRAGQHRARHWGRRSLLFACQPCILRGWGRRAGNRVPRTARNTRRAGQAAPRQAFRQLKPIDVLTKLQRLRTSPERSHLPFVRETQRRPTRSSTTTWVSFPRRWSRGFKRCSTGFVHRTVPLPQTCAVRVPARLPFAILPPRQSILRQPLNKTAGGLMQRSSFPTRFALKRQRNKNFSSTRRKSLLL